MGAGRIAEAALGSSEEFEPAWISFEITGIPVGVIYAPPVATLLAPDLS